MPSGGYRKPGNPAPVSGPGALARRTDGGPGDSTPEKLRGDGSYGQSKDLAEIQSGAQMQGQQSDQGLQPYSGAGFDSPSARPGEPVTHGADGGDGAGPEVLGIPDEDAGDVQALVAYLPVLEFMANRPNASPSTRAMIRRIKSRL